METIQQILIREKDSGNGKIPIYLYKIDDYWFAYERSAFYLFSICCVDAVFKYSDEEKNPILITVFKNGNEKAFNPKFRIVKYSEDQIIMDCGIICKGFKHWKEGLIPVFKDLNIEKIVHDFHYSLC